MVSEPEEYGERIMVAFEAFAELMGRPEPRPLIETILMIDAGPPWLREWVTPPDFTTVEYAIAGGLTE